MNYEGAWREMRYIVENCMTLLKQPHPVAFQPALSELLDIVESHWVGPDAYRLDQVAEMEQRREHEQVSDGV